MSHLALLSRQDLRALTDRATRAGVIAWLKKHGWVYEVGATGWPKVSADYAAMRLGGAKAEAPSSEPDWSAMRAA